MVKSILSCLLGSFFMIVSTESDAQPASAVSSETLLKTSHSWDGASYTSFPNGIPELSILKITVPAHTSLGWHTHPMPNVAYVLSGHITVEKKSDGSKKTIQAGETLAETVDTIHRGFTDGEPVTLIVFYAGAKGLYLSEAAR